MFDHCANIILKTLLLIYVYTAVIEFTKVSAFVVLLIKFDLYLRLSAFIVNRESKNEPAGVL